MENKAINEIIRKKNYSEIDSLSTSRNYIIQSINEKVCTEPGEKLLVWNMN